MLRWMLMLLCVLLRPFRRSSWTYPQTWYFMPHRRRLRYGLQLVCGELTGHEVSTTEHGYGGGRYEDYHCRWCDKLIRKRARLSLQYWGLNGLYERMQQGIMPFEEKL